MNTLIAVLTAVITDSMISLVSMQQAPLTVITATRPGSVEGSGRGQVMTDPLFGQANYAMPIAGTPMFAHVNPIGASVQGLRFIAMPPQLISSPIVSQPMPMVRYGATPPVSVATLPVSGGYAANMSTPLSFDTTGLYCVMYRVQQEEENSLFYNAVNQADEEGDESDDNARLGGNMHVHIARLNV